MLKTNHSLMQDRQFRRYFAFLLTFCLLLFFFILPSAHGLTASVKTMLLSREEAIASSLLDQGVPDTVIAAALTETDAAHSREASDLLSKIGVRPALEAQFLPGLRYFQRSARSVLLAVILPFCFLLPGVSLFFLHKREKIYLQATDVIDRYAAGDYSCRLSQANEGAVYQMLSAVDRLATMLQAQKETERNARIFLKNTISDISHQLKTPLAALSMYQEIMENEPDQPDVIRSFAAKTGLALRRMEQLIGSMLKITRLDAGSVVFEKKRCTLSALVSHAVSELTTRAVRENKSLLLEGSGDASLLCDPVWTSEAIGNIVKNALDHTAPQGTIRITWDSSPLTARIQITDDGEGIAPEDIYHIFKRFYRSSASSDAPGVGLGLPLARSIVEGQGGTVSVSSTPHAGTTFTILFG